MSEPKEVKQDEVIVADDLNALKNGEEDNGNETEKVYAGDGVYL